MSKGPVSSSPLSGHSAEKLGELTRKYRTVGLAADLSEEWIEAVQRAKVADEFSHLNVELD